MTVYLRLVPLIVCCWSLSATLALAQSDMERERRTLQGISDFYLSLNTEGNATVQDSLDFSRLHRELRTRLREAGLPVRSEDRDGAVQNIPYLHIHINAVHAGRGLYPFGIQIRFYQAVHLSRAPSIQSVATTWSTGMTGLASYDKLSLIPETALILLEEFIDAFHLANS